MADEYTLDLGKEKTGGYQLNLSKPAHDPYEWDSLKETIATTPHTDTEFRTEDVDDFVADRAMQDLLTRYSEKQRVKREKKLTKPGLIGKLWRGAWKAENIIMWPIKQMIRPISAFWGSVYGGEEAKQQLKRAQEFGYFAQPNERMSFPFYNMKRLITGDHQLWMKVEFKDKTTGETTRTLEVPLHEYIGMDDKTFKSFLKASPVFKYWGQGALKGIKFDDYYTAYSVINALGQMMDPERKNWIKVFEAVGSFGLELLADPLMLASAMLASPAKAAAGAAKVRALPSPKLAPGAIKVKPSITVKPPVKLMVPGLKDTVAGPQYGALMGQLAVRSNSKLKAVSRALANKPGLAVPIAEIVNSKLVLGSKSLLNLWSDEVRHIYNRARQIESEERTKFLARHGEQLAGIARGDTSFSSIVKGAVKRAGIHGKAAQEQVAAEFVRELYLISKTTERFFKTKIIPASEMGQYSQWAVAKITGKGDKQKAYIRIRDFAREQKEGMAKTLSQAIDSRLPTLTKQEKKEILGFFGKVKAFLNADDIQDLKAIHGLSPVVHENFPWWMPRRLKGQDVILKEPGSRQMGRPKDLMHRTLDTLDELLEHFKYHGESIDINLPKVFADDWMSHSHYFFWKAFRDTATADLTNMGLLTHVPPRKKVTLNKKKEWVTIKPLLEQLFQVARRDIESQVRQVRDWATSKGDTVASLRHLTAVKYLQDAGLDISGTWTKESHQKTKAFLLGHNLLKPLGETGTYLGKDLSGAKGLRITKNVPTYITTKEVATYFRDLQQSLFTPDVLSGIVKFLHILNAPFKYMAIVLNPFFHPKYWSTDTFQLLKSGVHPGIALYELGRSAGIKLAAVSKNATVKYDGEVYNAREFLQFLDTLGFLKKARGLLVQQEGRWYHNVIRNYTSPTFIRGVQEALRSPFAATAQIDDTYRLAAFLNHMKRMGHKFPKASELKDYMKFPWEKGYKVAKDALESATHVLKHFYSYQLPPFAKKYIRPFFPFLPWLWENIPEMMRFFWQWDKLLLIGRGQQVLEDIFPGNEKHLKPSYVKDHVYEVDIRFGDAERSEGLHVYFSVPTALKDLTKFSLGSKGLVSLFSQTGVLGAAIATTLAVTWFPNFRSTEGRWVEAPYWSVLLAKQGWLARMPNLWNVSMNIYTGETRLLINETVMRACEHFAPALNTSKRMFPRHSAIRVMIDYDKIPDEYKYSKYMVETVKGTRGEVEYILTKEDPSLLPLEGAPPSRKEVEQARLAKLYFPFLQWSAVDYEREQWRRQKAIINYMEKTLGAKRYGDFIVYPPHIEGLDLIGSELGDLF